MINHYTCYEARGIAENVFGLGEVERQPVRWENFAKPVLPAVGNV